MEYKRESGRIRVPRYRKEHSIQTVLILYGLLLLSFFILNYNPQTIYDADSLLGWVFAIISTVCILILMRRLEPVRWQEDLGLVFSAKDICTGAVFFVALLFGVAALLSVIADSNGYVYSPSLVTYYLEKQKGNEALNYGRIIPLYLYHIPQTFNEEMISGSLLLKKIRQRYSWISDLWIACGVALLFCLAHVVFYRLTPAQIGTLEFASVITLFLAGWIRNVLILAGGSILYAWMLHLAWNLLFFPSYYYIKYTRFVLRGETDRINLILGDWRTVLVVLVIGLCVGIWYGRKKHRQ
ncbi:MAG: CPBP family intramembrane glutamic endopeptidase [Spirochaetota bacterium]